MALPECPFDLTVKFGRKLVEALGGNSQYIKEHWCWKDFGAQYPDLRQKAEDYFAAAKTGDPALAAYFMYKYFSSSREWAEALIAKSKIGEPAFAAYVMHCHGSSSREWAEDVIAAARVGNTGRAAHLMWRACGSSFEWLRSIK